MNLDKDNKQLKITREPQLIGEKKERTRVKSHYDIADISRKVLESYPNNNRIEDDRTIRRIVELMNKLTGNNKLKISDEEIFNKIVSVTKRIYDDGKLSKLLRKETKGEKLTSDEYDTLIDVFIQELNRSKSTEEQKEYQNIIKALKGDDLIKEAIEFRNLLNKKYTDNVNILLELNDYKKRVEIFNKYKTSMSMILASYEVEIEKAKKTEIKFQEALKSLKEKEPDLFNTDEFKNGEISEELQVRLAIEMDWEEIIEDAKEYFNCNE